MARLVECCPSSDDDLPDLNTLLHKSSVRATKELKPTAPNAETRPIVSKSTSKSGSRRVRRLGESGQTTANPLFQRWGSEESKTSQSGVNRKTKEPRPRTGQVPERTSSKSPPCDSESEDDEPQLRVRASRRRRQHTIDDPEDDFEGSSTSSEEENLLTRVRNLRRNRSDTVIEPRREPGQKPLRAGTAKIEKESLPPRVRNSQENRSETAQEPKKEKGIRVSRAAVKENSKARKFAKDLDSGSETETAQEEAENEDPSVYKTAEENSSDTSNNSGFNSEFDESPFQPSRKLKLKPQTLSTRKPSEPKRIISLTKSIPSLDPKMFGQRKTSSGSQKGDSSLGRQPTSTKGDTQRRKSSQRKESGTLSTRTATASDLADTFAKLRIQLQDFSDDDSKPSIPDQFTTPPSTPPKTSKPKGLISPTKRIAIPETPHRPSTDAFWNQDLVNDWNDQHSPRKLMLPPVTKSPSKASPKKSPKKDSKKAFDARKHALAEGFFLELDREITQGKIAELAKSTGGVKLVWTKTLNTTAGRASWRRETIRKRNADGSQVSVEYKHHSSIELAEKVIDDEHRLLNVMAHEFCHLANFMVTGMTTNPHGKEFKAWAAKCSRAFGDRGIQVTTKHSYEIDFKYVWECEECATEFKRHSKSIDPMRHRCGSCKGMLKQTKPVPRGKAAGASKYQIFVKEQMAVVRGENPGSPQKDVMKLIAEKWAKQGGKAGKSGVDKMAGKMVDMTLEDEV